MMVYALVPVAVYRHGVVGVYANEEEAVAAGRALWEASDGHHSFAVCPRDIGETYEPECTLAYHESDPEYVAKRRRQAEGWHPDGPIRTEDVPERWP